MVLTSGQRSLYRFRDIKVHPIVLNAVNKVNVTTNVGADGTATTLGPGVGAVVCRGIGRGGPGLQDRSNSHGFIFCRTGFGKEAQFGPCHPCAVRLGHLAERDTNQRRRLVAAGGFSHDQRGGVLLCVIRT